MANVSQTIMEFERGRQQLANISMQKQQLQMQSDSLFQTLEELKGTKEEKVFKFAGTVMLESQTTDVVKDVENKKESVDLRLKSVLKQETILVDKLSKLREEIEKSSGNKQSKVSSKNEESEDD